MSKTKPYKLLGIDPGTNILGFAVVETDGKHFQLLEMGCLKLKGYTDHHHRLKRIFERVQSIIDFHRPRDLAIEAPFFGKNVQSMLKLGRAQGVAIAAAITRGLSVHEYSPKKIKQSVTGNGNATKEQVAAMLESILHVKLDAYSLDATDALATAICHFYQSKNTLGGSKKYAGWESFIKDNANRLK